MPIRIVNGKSEITGGRVPVEDIHNWLGHIVLGKGSPEEKIQESLEDADEFAKIHFTNNVREAIAERVSFETFFANFEKELVRDYGQEIDKTGLESMKNIIKRIWDTEIN